MNKILSALFILFLSPHLVVAQIWPGEGVALNYRLVGISFPAVQKTSKYKIEIAPGNYNSEDSFSKKITVTLSVTTNKTIAEVPSFGAQYTWRTVYIRNRSTIKSRLHHFSVPSIPNVDTNNTRLRIISAMEKYKDAYIFLDGNRVLYDMNGRPVWYLRDIGGLMNKPDLLRDLKLSPKGTITFLLGEKAYEINYNGDILWQAPGNNFGRDSSPHYHHEFTRLASGHYMVLGNDFVPFNSDQAGGNTGNRKRQSGTIIEYDEKGNRVWSWNSSSFFLSPGNNTTSYDTHENAFFFDQDNNAIYLSFRGTNEILKVQYPSGKVLAVYGQPQAMVPAILYSAGSIVAGARKKVICICSTIIPAMAPLPCPK